MKKGLGQVFFKIDFTPEYAQSGVCNRTGKRYTTGLDVKAYLKSKNLTLDLFADDSPISCSSYYNMCE